MRIQTSEYLLLMLCLHIGDATCSSLVSDMMYLYMGCPLPNCLYCGLFLSWMHPYLLGMSIYGLSRGSLLLKLSCPFDINNVSFYRVLRNKNESKETLHKLVIISTWELFYNTTQVNRGKWFNFPSFQDSCTLLGDIKLQSSCRIDQVPCSWFLRQTIPRKSSPAHKDITASFLICWSFLF